MTKKTCLVIGAGIAGLMAATRLQEAGVEVTVVDKGRGVGGRMASRRITVGYEAARADHGAQYFTVYSETLRPYADAWLNEGVIREWARGFYDSDGKPHVNDVPRYVGVGGMTAVAKKLAQSLTVHTATKVTQLAYDGQFLLKTEDGEGYSSDMLLMTPPAPQTLALLNSGTLRVSAEIIQALEQIAYNPCFALLAVLDRPSRVPKPGGVWPIGGEPISWIADNQQKGVSSLPSLTIHAGPDFTKAHLDADRDAVVQRLLEAAQPYIGDARVERYQVHRWLYSIPTQLHPARCLFTDSPAPLAFAGDAFDGSRVEGAALSGLAAADVLLEAAI